MNYNSKEKYTIKKIMFVVFMFTLSWGQSNKKKNSFNWVLIYYF